MKRIITVLTVAALMAMMLVASAGYAFGYAYSEEDPGTGPSQGTTTEQAEGNCIENYEKQADNEVATGGGPKAGEAGDPMSSPTNCDHFYQGAFEEEDPGSTVIARISNLPVARAGHKSLGPSSGPYSPKCLEEVFSEVRQEARNKYCI